MTAEPVGRYERVGHPPATRQRARPGAPAADHAATTTTVGRGATTKPGRGATAKPGHGATAIPAPRTAPERATRPSAPPVPVAAPRAPFVLLVLVLVAAGIVGLLVLNTAINTNSFALQQLRDKQDQLDSQQQEVSQELADRESPGSLRAAAARMGLVPAGRSAYIRLPDGKVIGVPQPAPPVSDPAAH